MSEAATSSIPAPSATNAASDRSRTIRARDTRRYRVALAVSLALLGLVLLAGLYFLF